MNQSTWALASVALMLSSFVNGAVAAGRKKGVTHVTADERSVDQAAQEQIAKWLRAVREIHPGDYVEVHDLRSVPDRARVEQDSSSWTQRFFTNATNPYTQKGAVRRSIHMATPDTFDVIRHEYDAVGKHLVVEETVNFILVTVEPPLDALSTIDERAKQDEIGKIAALVLRMSGTKVATNLQEAPYHWAFRFPATIHEGTTFSTNPEQSPQRMWSWASRLDGGIYGGRLYFLCFKKGESTSGRMFTLDAQHWFDGKCWAALER